MTMLQNQRNHQDETPRGERRRLDWLSEDGMDQAFPLLNLDRIIFLFLCKLKIS